MFGFYLGAYYGFVLGFLGAVAYRHWLSLYDGPTPRIHKEDVVIDTGGIASSDAMKVIWRRDGGP